VRQVSDQPKSGGEPPSIYRCRDPAVILRLCRKHRGNPSTHNRSVTEVALGVLSGGPGRGMIAETCGTWQRARGSCTSITIRWSAVLVVALSAWVLPQSIAPQQLGRVTHARTALVDWLRTHTPCNAQFLSNQRNEGVFTTLTGRPALLEGMGAFLRVDKMPHVVNLFLAARQFFQSPLSPEAFLRQHGISYVVLERQPELLGSQATTGQTNFHDMRAAPFLHQVMANRSVIIYQVQGAHPPPVSPLLKGPYLHCITTPVRF
jgi:hypothetical protein